MKNTKIEALIKKARDMEKEFGRDSKEMKEFNKANQLAWRWTHAYLQSQNKGFDEIVITDCVFEEEVEKFFELGRKLGVSWFVFATGFSNAFETMDCFVQHGARIGKFVVKEYTTTKFGEEETFRLPGMRINL